MPVKTLDKAEHQERRKHARRWLQFRKDFLYTQEKLAEALKISRRTVQLIEGGRVTPNLTTQRVFRDYSLKCQREEGRAA
jgi:DNA-binding XRE family transcriptional regulator